MSHPRCPKCNRKLVWTTVPQLWFCFICRLRWKPEDVEDPLPTEITEPEA